MIERWLVAIRDNANRPSAAQCLVLHMLALRMDWHTGRGYASARQLAADAAASERTVRRSITWARETGYLTRTRRGHRVSSELVIASEWQLTKPGYPQAESQPATSDLLGKPTGLNGRPNRPMGPTQPVSGAPPSVSVSSVSVSSQRAQRFEDQAPTPAPPAFSDLCRRCGSHKHSSRDCPH